MVSIINAMPPTQWAEFACLGPRAADDAALPAQVRSWLMLRPPFISCTGRGARRLDRKATLTFASGSLQT